MTRIKIAHAHHPAHAAMATAASLAAAALAVACASTPLGEVDDRYGIANQLAGSTYGEAGPDAGPTGTGGGAAVPPPPPMPAMPAAPDAPSGPPQECNGEPAPTNGLLVDFGTYTARTATGGGAWGDTGLDQITGGTSVYSGDAASALDIVVQNGELKLTATMAAAMAYTGIVLWFAPCVNASTFSGLSFPISGDLGGATMLVKAQASPNYPVDVANSKGKCEYPREDMKFTTCQQPTATISELSENPLTLAWSEFVGGTPVAALDPSQLLGFELQFQCQSGNCALDISVGDVQFMP